MAQELEVHDASREDQERVIVFRIKEYAISLAQEMANRDPSCPPEKRKQVATCIAMDTLHCAAREMLRRVNGQKPEREY